MHWTDKRLFFLLQFLDCVTTIVGLSAGMSEGNPFVSAFFPFFGHFWGVFASKLTCVAIFYPLLLRSNPKILLYCNMFFALLVAWNTVIVAAVLLSVI